METKMITIPFDVERAKKIQAGEEPGKIVTRDGKDARVAFWDLRSGDDKHILVVYERDHGYQGYGTRFLDGRINDYMENDKDLMLQVPEWMQFKDGDILSCKIKNGKHSYCRYLYILKDNINPTEYSICFKSYVSYSCNPKDEFDELSYDDNSDWVDSIRLATDDEKQQLIDALKASTDPRAKEYLKRFFGIEKKPEYKFEPFDKVLVRYGDDYIWEASLFSHISDKKDEPFNTVGGINYEQCIPYNGQTKHLLGTTDEWEE